MGNSVAVIGRGTAGCLTAAFWINQGFDIDWYYSSDIKPTPVGEGTTPSFMHYLNNVLNIGFREMINFDASSKVGIRYRNWGDDRPDWNHYFDKQIGIHFNASKFQDYVLNHASTLPNINMIDKIVVPQDMTDYAHVLCCTGKPANVEDEYTTRKYIPVNAVHVTQCYRTLRLESSFTDTIARPWGWVFIVPLQNRASVGYLYNKDITSLDAVKEDVKNVFDEYGLTPSEVTNSFAFNNYVKNDFIKGNVFYNGNSAFFLEPMEATTLDCTLDLMESYFNIAVKGSDVIPLDAQFRRKLDEIELFIMLRYAAGSRFNNEFWDFAKQKGQDCIEDFTKQGYNKDHLYNSIKDTTAPHREIHVNKYFTDVSMQESIDGLGIKDLLKRYVT